ncbi:antifreeze protein [Chromatiales bacterium (ex Bugula neritina AB1)]|nr:antifreeze protein [Chromatiales bacterium (ex Bugula neritina AB1)]
MGLFDKLFGEFVDVIEWTDDTNDTMVYRFERYGNEIKYGAKLTVREGQAAVFVNEGEVADVLSPGMYELETRNLPILSTALSWDHAFSSPFKAEVYFISTRRFVDLKWGTKNPLMMRDPEFGAARVRAFGTYAVKVADPLKFMREIVGTDGNFQVDEISNQLRNLITSRFSSAVGASGIPVLDMAANYEQLGDVIIDRISPEFGEYGLELTRLLVENISVPPAVEEALDKRTSAGMVGNLDKYMQYQTGVALEAGAENPGGAAGAGIGMGAGLAMGHQMANSMQPGSSSPSAEVTSANASAALPPPLPASKKYHLAVDGEAIGPFEIDGLEQYLANGTLTRDSLVWASGMDDWAPAGEQAALAELFSRSTPPPLPRG